jgi:hypothetical protein
MPTDVTSTGEQLSVRFGVSRATLAFAALTSLALVAAGCGGGSPSDHVAQLGSTGAPASSTGASSPGSGSQAAIANAVKFANCMRSHGVTNYPDPNSSGHPQSLNQINPNSATFLTAYTACRSYASNGAGVPPEPSPAELRSALAFARCVRKHGYPQFPDPLTTVSLQATFTLGPGKYFPVNSSYKATAPAFMHAAKACGVRLS